jgi:hypothetical protein
MGWTERQGAPRGRSPSVPVNVPGSMEARRIYRNEALLDASALCERMADDERLWPAPEARAALAEAGARIRDMRELLK